jgi:hypothetical protein
MTSLLMITFVFLQGLSRAFSRVFGDPGTKIAGTKMRRSPEAMMAHLGGELKDKDKPPWLRGKPPKVNPFGGVGENPYVSYKICLS